MEIDSANLSVFSDWLVYESDMDESVFEVWRDKMQAEDQEQMLEWKDSLLEDDDSRIGGTCPVPVMMRSLQLLSEAKNECGDNEALMLCVTNKIHAIEESDCINEISAINPLAYKSDVFDSDFYWGLDQESMWIVGSKGIACLETEFANSTSIYNPLQKVLWALRSACGEEQAQKEMLDFIANMEGELLPKTNQETHP